MTEDDGKEELKAARVDWERLVFSQTGHNHIKTLGMLAVRYPTDKVVDLAPITSKGAASKAYISVPLEEINRVVGMLDSLGNGLLEHIRTEIAKFEAVCRSDDHTDSEAVWELLYTFRGALELMTFGAERSDEQHAADLTEWMALLDREEEEAEVGRVEGTEG